MVNKDDAKTRKALGEHFKQARERAGLTQADVAKLSGLNVNYYAVVERGEGNPSFEKLQKIMKALKIKSLDIF